MHCIADVVCLLTRNPAGRKERPKKIVAMCVSSSMTDCSDASRNRNVVAGVAVTIRQTKEIGGNGLWQLYVIRLKRGTLRAVLKCNNGKV